MGGTEERLTKVILAYLISARFSLPLEKREDIVWMDGKKKTHTEVEPRRAGLLYT